MPLPGPTVYRRASNVPNVGTSKAQLGYGVTAQSWDKSFNLTTRAFKSNYYSTGGIPARNFKDWDSENDHRDLDAMVEEFFSLHGKQFWPSSPESTFYNENLIYSRDEDRIKFHLKLMFFKSIKCDDYHNSSARGRERTSLKTKTILSSGSKTDPISVDDFVLLPRNYKVPRNRTKPQVIPKRLKRETSQPQAPILDDRMPSTTLPGSSARDQVDRGSESTVFSTVENAETSVNQDRTRLVTLKTTRNHLRRLIHPDEHSTIRARTSERRNNSGVSRDGITRDSRSKRDRRGTGQSSAQSPPSEQRWSSRPRAPRQDPTAASEAEIINAIRDSSSEPEGDRDDAARELPDSEVPSNTSFQGSDIGQSTPLESSMLDCINGQSEGRQGRASKKDATLPSSSHEAERANAQTVDSTASHQTQETAEDTAMVIDECQESMHVVPPTTTSAFEVQSQDVVQTGDELLQSRSMPPRSMPTVMDTNTGQDRQNSLTSPTGRTMPQRRQTSSGPNPHHPNQTGVYMPSTSAAPRTDCGPSQFSSTYPRAPTAQMAVEESHPPTQSNSLTGNQPSIERPPTGQAETGISDISIDSGQSMRRQTLYRPPYVEDVSDCGSPSHMEAAPPEPEPCGLNMTATEPMQQELVDSDYLSPYARRTNFSPTSQHTVPASTSSPSPRPTQRYSQYVQPDITYRVIDERKPGSMTDDLTKQFRGTFWHKTMDQIKATLPRWMTREEFDGLHFRLIHVSYPYIQLSWRILWRRDDLLTLLKEEFWQTMKNSVPYMIENELPLYFVLEIRALVDDSHAGRSQSPNQEYEVEMGMPWMARNRSLYH